VRMQCRIRKRMELTLSTAVPIDLININKAKSIADSSAVLIIWQVSKVFDVFTDIDEPSCFGFQRT
jgi:hypothetical protein